MPKVVRTDNAREFISHACQKLFKESSIIHQKSVVCTPQHNGKVEKNHHHLLDIARQLVYTKICPNKKRIE